MNWILALRTIALSFFLTLFGSPIVAQIVPIQQYSTNANGQVELKVNSSSDHYYLLHVKHHVDSAFSEIVSMTLGEAGSTAITEPLEAYPLTHYQITQHALVTPDDTDGDGIDDLTEFQNMPEQNPLNYATSIDLLNGQVAVNNFSTFNSLSVQQDVVPWIPYLNGKEYVKFIILDYFSPNRKIYFINTNTHPQHENFANFMGVGHLGPTVVKGQVIYHPNVLSSNGTLGTFAFNYTNNESKPFSVIQKTQELLAANMPFLTNNLSYYVTEENEDDYHTDQNLFQNSRVPVLFETDIYAGLDYWGLNQTEGFGYFRHVGLDEVPGPKDIVLYDYLPNSLPRVGGIMTSVIQTPLSHVNLRAIQDNIPNAFIRDPLDNDTVLNLLNHYIYYKVEQSKYTIREASLEEVNAWYENMRPPHPQIPPLNLDYTAIKPLDHITFDMFDGFGAKCTNIAAMRTFGFPEGTIPDGFGVPFYFYQEFMKYNHFFDEIKITMKDPAFENDRDVRDSLLSLLREKMENGKLPDWMWNALGDMQRSFPQGVSIRCRSSTNNEDLPGFSGAGLYDSKTQHPDEGHIAKSVKQVFASLWNLRAFDEREFYRVDHFHASMGVLCHPNYTDEKVNGVGVSSDPVYNTKHTFYLNSQLEGELITNPGSAKPEEILLNQTATGQNGYSVIQYSSLVGNDSLLMRDEHLDQLRAYLKIIHSKFSKLYNAENNSTFAMDIEYKITSNDQLIIKQARPWVTYEYQYAPKPKVDKILVFPNPATAFINVDCPDCGLTALRITDISGRIMLEKEIALTGSANHPVNIEDFPPGIYFVSAFVGPSLLDTKKIIKP